VAESAAMVGFRAVLAVTAIAVASGVWHGIALAHNGSRNQSVWDGVYTDVQAKRGEQEYRNACASCHLDSLGGADMASPLVGDPFLTKWNELSVGDLFERTRISMPQDSPASLSRQAYIDIVAYILQANKLPAGEHELGHDLATLKHITILSKRN
jgi:mono/diheme cytochrome c family protein